MNKQYFISDLHFDHRSIVKYRPDFADTVEEHNERLLDNILSTIGKKDTLWILGDTCFSYSSVKYMESIRNYVWNLKVLFGNHCTDSKERRDAAFRIASMADQWHGMIRLKDMWVQHSPVHPDELRGKWCVHGHVHNVNIPDRRYINVSCENINYHPVSLDYIKNFLRDRPEEIFTVEK